MTDEHYPTPSVPDIETLELDAPSRAFYAGVSAGLRAVAKLDEAKALQADATPEDLLALYWLTIGTLLPAAVPEPEAELQAAFLAGAAIHAPRRQQPAFELLIPTLDVAPFRSADGEPLDEEQLVRRVVATLQRTWSRITDGAVEGDVLAGDPVTGRLIPVGTFRLDIA